MSETVKNVDLKVMGARFQKIRQRLQLNRPMWPRKWVAL
jgi:hypothetical protein